MTGHCSAINNAMKAQGLSNAQLAGKVSLSEQQVNDILNGSQKPTDQQYNSIARALGISNPASGAAHATK